MPFFDAFDEEMLHGVSVTHSMGVILDYGLTLKHHAPAVVNSAFLKGALGLDFLMM